MNLTSLEQEILNCKKCSRLCSINPYPMPHVYYNKNITELKLFIIARNPGIEHNYTEITKEEYLKIYHERWFNCNIAEYFKEIFGEDIIKQNVFFANVCKCSSPKNTALTNGEIKNCKNFLIQQLEIVKPKIILTFGKEAKNFFISYKYNEARIFNFFHPSYFNYNQDKKLKERQNYKIKRVIRLLDE